MQIRMASLKDKLVFDATMRHHSEKNSVNLKGKKASKDEAGWFEEVLTKPMYCNGIECECEGCLFDVDIFVIYDRLDTVGYFIASYDEEEAEIEYCTTPQYVGKGYGDRIIDLGMIYTQRLRPQIAYFRADCVNDASKDLCLRAGFAKGICGDYFFYID